MKTTVGDYPIDLSLPRTPSEGLAMIEGQLAMLDLTTAHAAGPARLAAFEKLRGAARLDPIAAYNLGNYFADPPGSLRPRRRQLSLTLFNRAIELGLARLQRPLQPYAKAPPREHGLRDIISRALTNIGAALANSGAPDRAVDYFSKALKLFPDNANAEVCLGNMGVYHHKRTGVDPLAAIAAWERAAALGESCFESDHGCPCRVNVTQVARQIERDYGANAARDWVSRRYPEAAARKSGRDFGPVARTAGDVARLAPGARWARRAVAAADALAPFLDAAKDQALEVKVTLAGSLVGSLCRLSSGSRPSDPAVLDRALAQANAAEPLEAFLGDEEWADLSPPETLYLTEPAMRTAITDAVEAAIARVSAAVPGLRPQEAVLGALFHLDRGFRRGVVAMVRHGVAEARVPLVYVPAVVIGSPVVH